MTIRTFQVDITMRKIVEVKINDECDMSADEDIEDVAQEVALERFNDSSCTFDEDYEVETVREITAKQEAA